ARFDTAVISEMSADTALGGLLHDTAWDAGAVEPTGAMHFDYYAPGDATCSGSPVFSADAPLVLLDAPLPYWVNATQVGLAVLLPDHHRSVTLDRQLPRRREHEPETLPCNAIDEHATVSAFPSTLTSEMSAAVLLGGQIHDTAHISRYGSLSGGTATPATP
ncbi:MAG: hypothetical protein JWN20_137, partial [Jatrophihabitantaceae bacterium]|nr:hypothetical protein [Jatrophihabitantaceae bacterium]